VLTLLPMVLYGLALTAIRLATASMINYLTPTLNFLCGLLFFAEPLEPLKLVTFVFIWSGLLVYTHAAIQRSRNGKT
jgi:chloramphenicol-sensitive protein RarD